MMKKSKFIKFLPIVITIASFMLVICLLMFAFISRKNKSSESSDVHLHENDFALAMLQKQVKNQNTVDEELSKIIKNKKYTISSPLIVKDPYDRAPLSAMVLFSTEKPTSISILIKGKNSDADISNKFSQFKTTHNIPIYGLYADYNNIVTITATDTNGKSQSSTINIKTKPLRLKFDNIVINVEMYKAQHYQNGMNFLSSPIAAFDKNGDYRWCLNDLEDHRIVTHRKNGRIMLIDDASDNDGAYISEIDFMGKVYSTAYTPYGVGNVVCETKNGNLITTGSLNGSKCDILYEFDVKNGNIVKEHNLKKIMQRTRKCYSYNLNANDWLGINDIVCTNDGILLSAANQAAIAKISWPDGKIKWIMSDDNGWTPRFQQYLLTSKSTEFDFPNFQSSIQVLTDQDNLADTIDVLVFESFIQNKRTSAAAEENTSEAAKENTSEAAKEKVSDANKTNDTKEKSSEVKHSTPSSRITQYRINETDRSIEVIWSYGAELGKNYITIPPSGNAEPMNNGNYLGNFIYQNSVDYSIENDSHPESSDSSNPLDAELAVAKYNDINVGYTEIFEVNSSGELVWEAELFLNNDDANYINNNIHRYSLYLPSSPEYLLEEKVVDLIPKYIVFKYADNEASKNDE